jgi:sugar O-acyltransferase (sialic acid O-acetyltransferase NeuD family)
MKVYVIGGGGLAGEVIDALCAHPASAGIEIAGIFDDDTRRGAGLVHGFPYKGILLDFIKDTAENSHYVWGIGDNAARERLACEFAKANKQPVTVIHPSAAVCRHTEIQAGCYVAAFSFVGPGSVIRAHSIVNVGASVGHNARIGDFAQLCPGVRVSGFCQVGRGAFLGSNSVLGPGRVMGDYSKLGACSFAFRDVPKGNLAVGVPAKVVL